MKKLLLCIALFATPSFAQNGSEIKIGVITDLSGHGAFWGKQTRLGAELLQEDLRQQGHNVSFVFGDSAFKATQAVSEAHKLFAADGVDALFVEFSSLVNAVSPIAEKSKRLLLATCGARTFLENNPYALKTFLNYEQGCRQIARYWKERGISKVGIMRVNAEIGELCASGARREFPSLFDGIFNPGEDVSSLLLKMKAAEVQAVFSSGYEGDMLNILKARQVLNYKIPIGGPDSDVLTAKVITEYQTELEGTVTFGFREVDETFRNRILKKDPSNSLTVIEAAANSYLFLGQLAHAIANCKKGDLNCQLKVVTSSGPDKLLAFKGWKNRVAEHDFVLTVWEKGGKVPVQ